MTLSMPNLNNLNSDVQGHRYQCSLYEPDSMLLLGLSCQHFLVEVVVFSLIAKRTLFSLIAKKEGEIGCTKWFRLQNSTERKRLKREDPSKDMLLCKTEGMLVPLIVVVTFALDRLCSQRIV